MGVNENFPMCVVNCTIYMMIFYTNMVYKEFPHHCFYVEVGFRGLWLKGLLIVILINISRIEGHCNTYEKNYNTLKRCRSITINSDAKKNAQLDRKWNFGFSKTHYYEKGSTYHL